MARAAPAAGSAAADRRTERLLLRLLWLSVAAAVCTISMKFAAWWITGSVGLLSDAAESVVNLLAAVLALLALRWAIKPPDEEHRYGHAKAEYFSAGAEGALIVVAAAAIAAAGVERTLNPQPLSGLGPGIAVAVAASAINLVVALVLVREGRRHRSLTVEADGRHLLTDVWTSAGVVAGVGAVGLTGFERLDGLVAVAVAAKIAITGVDLVRRSVGGLMDRSLDEAEHSAIEAALAPFRARGLQFHALRTRQAGRRAFVSVHVVMPGAWSLARAHDVAEEVEAAVRAAVPYATVFTHAEPAEDPRSFDDAELDRPGAP